LEFYSLLSSYFLKTPFFLYHLPNIQAIIVNVTMARPKMNIDSIITSVVSYIIILLKL